MGLHGYRKYHFNDTDTYLMEKTLIRHLKLVSSTCACSSPGLGEEHFLVNHLDATAYDRVGTPVEAECAVALAEPRRMVRAGDEVGCVHRD